MKKITIIVIPILVIIGGILLFVASNFKTDLLLCNKENGDCEVIAQFKDFETCKTMNERWSWYCNSTDPSEITCHTGEGALGFAYCKQ